MADTIFEALVAAIIAVGSGHMIASIYRRRQEQRRWREAVKRLRFGVSNASN
jgi:GH24 family phage-related lysozyme (muramidase)